MFRIECTISFLDGIIRGRYTLTHITVVVIKIKPMCFTIFRRDERHQRIPKYCILNLFLCSRIYIIVHMRTALNIDQPYIYNTYSSIMCVDVGCKWNTL